MSWVAVAGAVVAAGTSIYTGIKQKNAAKKMQEENSRPVSPEVPQEVKENKLAANMMANVGLPSAQYTQAQQNIQRSQNNVLQGAQDRRAGLGLIGAIQQHSNDAGLSLDVANANARINAQRNLQGINNTAAQYRTQAFDWNQKQKYVENANAARAMAGAGNANLYNGIDRGLSGALMFGGRMAGGQNSGLYNGNSGASMGGQQPLFNNGAPIYNNGAVPPNAEFQTQEWYGG